MCRFHVKNQNKNKNINNNNDSTYIYEMLYQNDRTTTNNASNAFLFNVG